MGSGTGLAAATAMLLATGLMAAQAQEPFRIGMIDDMSGVYSGNGSPNIVLATQMTVEDFSGKVLGRPIEVLQFDH